MAKRKRDAADDPSDDLLETIPWASVFQFLGGEDVARALMTSKSNSPWKKDSGSGHQHHFNISGGIVLVERERFFVVFVCEILIGEFPSE